MTNVKLKLMFYLLNALLTASFVHARPYANYTSNTTEIIVNISNTTESEIFNIPVDSNSDTLIVANDDQTPEQTNKNSKAEMESIVNAEQDRDRVILGGKSEKEITTKILELPKTEAEEFEKQLNISSPLLEDIIDSETNREETLTDIQFRPDDIPRFEFLISGRINETGVGNKSDYVPSENSLDKVNASDVLKKIDYVELVALGRQPKISENKSEYNLGNITGHEVDNDIAPDTRFTDLQTLFLACFGTLVPLLAVLFATLCIRCMCRRWCPGCCRKASESIDSDSSSSKQDGKQRKSTPNESTNLAGETLDNEEVSPPGNGSIITMTLQNNHLIVETEERSDIKKNGRETKMKYSPDNDGIFVVEVQQSAVYRPTNKAILNSPPLDPQISTNQALIHRVPEEIDVNLGTILNTASETDKQKELLSCTGLSISDLSMSSIGSHNVSYTYGSQIGYEQGPFGYPVYAGYEVPREAIGDGIIHESSREPLISKTPTDPDKPVVTAAIFKQDSIIGNDVIQVPGYCIEGSSDGPLLSDVQAREVSLQQLHNQMGNKLENGVAEPILAETPKKQLNRADSLPVRLEEESVPHPVIDVVPAMEPIREDEDVSKDMFRGKRASLPKN